MKLFLNLNNAINIFLLKNNLVDFSKLYTVLIYAIKKKDIVITSNIVLIGFLSISYILKKFFKVLLKKNSIKLDLKKLKKKKLKIFKIYFESSMQEYKSAIIWSKKKLEENKTYKVCILVPNLNKEKNKIVRLLHESSLSMKNYSILLPRYMSKFELVKIFICLLDLFIEPTNYYIFSYLLRSPYISNAFLEHNLRLKSDSYIKGHKEHFYYIETVIKKLFHSPIIREYLKKLNKLKRNQLILEKSAFYWKLFISKYIKIFGFPNKNILDKEEKYLFKKLEKVLNDYSQLHKFSDKQSIIKYILALKSLLSTTRLINRKKYSVDIRDYKEDMFFNFDHLWICNLTKIQRTYQVISPFIPKYLQTRYIIKDFNWKNIISNFIFITKYEINFSSSKNKYNSKTTTHFFLNNLKIKVKTILEKKPIKIKSKNIQFTRNIKKNQIIKRVYGGVSSIYTYDKCSFKSYFITGFKISKTVQRPRLRR